MAYQLKLGEPLEDGVRRILATQGRRAEASLNAPDDAVAAIHDARRSLKRMRALLRLVRSAIGETTFQRENGALRDVAGLLSQQRDQDVLRQTIEALRDAQATLPSLHKSLDILKGILRSTRADARADNQRRRLLAEAAVDMARQNARLENIRVTGTTLEMMEHGVRRGHARARRSLAALEAHPTPEVWHDLRKAMQLHWRHMGLLTAAWAPVMQARSGEARRISGLLGEARDLELLEVEIANRRLYKLTPAARAAVVGAAKSRRHRLRQEAIPRVQRLLLENPSRFTRQICTAWKIAQVLRRDGRDDDCIDSDSRR